MEDKDDLPTEFDVIVVGTGMVESIVAASCARIGKTVLHLDRNLYYGDYWATLGLEALEEFAKFFGNPDDFKQPIIENEFGSTDLKALPTSRGNVIHNLTFKWFIPTLNQEDLSKEIKEDVSQPAPDFNETTADKPPDSEFTNENSGQINTNNGSGNEEIVNEVEGNASKETSDTGEIVSKPSERSDIDWNVHLLKDQSRKFNIDLAPKVIYSTGSMVDLLLRSCVYRYSEFQSVSQILALVKTSSDSTCKLQLVPCTKSDVFSNRCVSVVDKRILMKVLNYCMNFSEALPEYEELKEQLFIDYLKREKVPEHLIQYIFYSIAMATSRTLFVDAVKRVQSFLKNVGRYGNSPFLWPLYGSGELLQAFCRLSAVYGGIYYLGRGAEAIVISNDTNKCQGILSNSKNIKANHIVTSTYFCPQDFLEKPTKTNRISRTILFTDRPLYPNEKESISLLHFPAKEEEATSPLVLVELPSTTGTCPKGLYIVHITYQQSTEDSSEVVDLINELFVKKVCHNNSQLHQDSVSDELIKNMKNGKMKDWMSQEPDRIQQDDSTVDKPNILYAFHYEIENTSDFSFSSNKPDNLHFCHGPDSSIDFDRAVKQARDIFTSMFPTEEFLEPTPDPNEITLSDLIGEENQQIQNQIESSENTIGSELQASDNNSNDDNKTEESKNNESKQMNNEELLEVNSPVSILSEQIASVNLNEN